MRSAEKEVQELENKAREAAGLPVENAEGGDSLPPIELPDYKVMLEQMRTDKKKRSEAERQQLEEKVAEVTGQMKEIQDRLKVLTDPGLEIAAASPVRSPIRSPLHSPDPAIPEKEADSVVAEKENAFQTAADETEEGDVAQSDENGAPGPPDGKYKEFPAYDGSEPPKECKKAFTHFCQHMRREVKASLDPTERKNKVSKTI